MARANRRGRSGAGLATRCGVCGTESSLIVPGYVDANEVSHIAEFIASLDPDIPYSLLALHPHFCLDDPPVTSRSHAEECLETARAAGLTRVCVGNLHPLGDAY